MDLTVLISGQFFVRKHIRKAVHQELPFLHAPPVDETIEVVEQEGCEADYHGQRGGIRGEGQQPEGDEHEVIGRVGQSVEGAA